MGCYTDKFVITKGQDNEFVFTIKANGSTEPMEITEGTDTFTASLVLLSDQSVTLTQELTIVNSLSGQVSLSISTAQADALVSGKGSAVDRYYLKPMYKLIIDCNTVNNGNFLAKICEVYVD